VAAANVLAAKLRTGSYTDDDLDAVRRRRLLPMMALQSLQVAVHNRVLRPVISGEVRVLTVPWPVRLLNATPWLRRWPAQLLGVGLRPERVRSTIDVP
jgi:hypothetical protein